MEKEKVFKCINELTIPMYDEYENLLENEEFTVPVDTEWVLQEHAFMSDIRLENDEMGWLEISFEDLKGCFAEI